SSGNVSLPIGNPFLLVAFVFNALSLPTIAPASLRQCLSSTPFAAEVDVTIGEPFATAFRPRASAGNQNQPGLIYNTESGFYADADDASGQPGIGARADYATRLKLTFNNVPAGVSLWVDHNGFKGGVPDPLIVLTASEAGPFSAVTPPDSGNLAPVTLSFGS